MGILVEGDPKAPFSIATASRCWGGCYFILDHHLIMLSVKQVGIKYHFLSLWYDSTWDWTPVSWTIGKHSTHEANGLVYIYIWTGFSIKINYTGWYAIKHNQNLKNKLLNILVFSCLNFWDEALLLLSIFDCFFFGDIFVAFYCIIQSILYISTFNLYI